MDPRRCQTLPTAAPDAGRRLDHRGTDGGVGVGALEPGLPGVDGRGLGVGAGAAWLIARFHFRGRSLLITLIDLPSSRVDKPHDTTSTSSTDTTTPGTLLVEAYQKPALTALWVAAGLTQAQINRNKKSDDYLLQDLDRVYTYGDKRTYPLSSYSYAIIPTPPASTLQRR